MTNQYSYVDSFSAKKTELPKKKIAESNISSAAKVYMLSRMRDDSAVNTYRNGNHNGQKYMTGEDFITYFQNRGKTEVRSENVAKRTTSSAEIYRSRSTTPAQKETTARYQKSYATPVKSTSDTVKIRKPNVTQPSSDTRMFAAVEEDVKIYTPGASNASSNISRTETAAFNKASNAGTSKIKKLADEWMPEDKIVNVKSGRKSRRSFSGTILAIAGVAVSLMLIVSGSVLMSGANREIKDLENELGKLTAVEKDLEAELEMKNDVNMLLDRATGELGMIRKEYVEANYLDVKGNDRVEIHDEEEKDMGIAAILSAFGIGN